MNCSTGCGLPVHHLQGQCIVHVDGRTFLVIRGLRVVVASERWIDCLVLPQRPKMNCVTNAPLIKANQN